MGERIDHAGEATRLIDERLASDPVLYTADAIEDDAWHDMEESVAEGWRTEVEADQLFYQWFKKHRVAL